MKRIINWGKKADSGDSRPRRPQAALNDHVEELRRKLDESQDLLADNEIPGVRDLRLDQAEHRENLARYSVPPGIFTRHTSRGFRAAFPNDVEQHLRRVKKLSDELEERRRGAISPLTDPRPFSFDESDDYRRSSTSPHSAGYRSPSGRPSYSTGRSPMSSPGYNQSQFDFDFGQGQDAEEDDQAPRGPRRSHSQDYLKDYLRNQQGPSSSGGQGQSSSQLQPRRRIVFVPVSSKVENLYGDGKLYTVYYDKYDNRALFENGAYRLL